MSLLSLSSKIAAFVTLSGAMAVEAFAASAQPGIQPIFRIGTPEIDGPAGIAAIALLVGVGMVVYNKYRK